MVIKGRYQTPGNINGNCAYERHPLNYSLADLRWSGQFYGCRYKNSVKSSDMTRYIITPRKLGSGAWPKEDQIDADCACRRSAIMCGVKRNRGSFPPAPGSPSAAPCFPPAPTGASSLSPAPIVWSGPCGSHISLSSLRWARPWLASQLQSGRRACCVVCAVLLGSCSLLFVLGRSILAGQCCGPLLRIVVVFVHVADGNLDLVSLRRLSAFISGIIRAEAGTPY